jgi:hypothetical protein
LSATPHPVTPFGPEKVRDACAWVADVAADVRLDDDALLAFAAHLADLRVDPPTYDTSLHFRGAEEATVAFVLTLDAINFGSGSFPEIDKRDGHSGYGTVASSLADHFRDDGAWSARELTEITVAELGRCFAQSPGNEEAWSLMSRFADALCAFGRWLLAVHDGRFLGPIEAAGGSASELVRELSICPAFRDVHRYRDRPVPLLKRAQITCWDLHLAFAGDGPGRFADLSRLTAFADNVVPHVLRLEGALRYSEQLASRIDSGERLLSGSPEEVELRACSVHAVERLVDAMRAEGVETTPARVDYLLWNAPRDARFRSLPRHRTITDDY